MERGECVEWMMDGFMGGCREKEEGIDRGMDGWMQREWRKNKKK